MRERERERERQRERQRERERETETEKERGELMDSVHQSVSVYTQKSRIINTCKLKHTPHS